jgi:eukaryotic-like serine/threonine-protein kinase
MGTVLAAHHELLDVRVAVKLLSRNLLKDPSLLDRFLREARAAARLKSEHVVRAMDVGTLADGVPYIVMELLEGEDLERRLARIGELTIPDAVDCLLQALEAMAHAHGAGIVHRDLKPANLFVASTPDGREVVKVLDFGIAKLTDVEPDGDDGRSGVLTGDNAVLGSPSYMAPEQVRNSREIDHRADIWALGTILYELMTGQVAFGGRSMGEIFVAVLHSRAPLLRARRPDAPAQLETAIGRCLEREPGRRFADVAEFARAIAPFGSGAWTGHVERIEQTLARAGKGGDADPASPPVLVSAPNVPRHLARAEVERVAGAETLPGSSVILPAKRRRRGPTLVVVSLGVVVAAVVVLSALRSDAPTRVNAASTATLAGAMGSAPLPPPPAWSARPPDSSSPSASARPSASAPSLPVSRTGKTVPGRVAPLPPKNGTSSARGLPGVLDSPE